MIPFVDLKAQYQSIKDEVNAAVLAVLESTAFVLGPEVEAFEALFAPYASSTFALGVNTGTSALHLALLAAEVGPGDEVITTAHTFIATVSAIDYCGARAVLVDVDPGTLCIDPSRIEAAITERTKAIIPVHLYGQPADMDPIMDIAERHGLIVIEDAAQAHGAEYKGRRCGSIGHLGCFSFYPGKNLGAYGEGGAVTTSDPALARRVRMLRDWGSEKRYVHELKGFNYRLEGVQGAVLRVKMGHIEHWTDLRIAAAARYDALLDPLEIARPAHAGGRHVYHLYVIRDRDRDRLQAHLTERGVSTGIHYPTPVHMQPAFADLGYRPGDFPHAEAAAAEVLSLPMYPELAADDQQIIADAIDEWQHTR